MRVTVAAFLTAAALFGGKREASAEGQYKSRYAVVQGVFYCTLMCSAVLMPVRRSWMKR